LISSSSSAAILTTLHTNNSSSRGGAKAGKLSLTSIWTTLTIAILPDDGIKLVICIFRIQSFLCIRGCFVWFAPSHRFLTKANNIGIADNNTVGTEDSSIVVAGSIEVDNIAADDIYSLSHVDDSGKNLADANRPAGRMRPGCNRPPETAAQA
jgi:hypothetical protein